MKTPAQKILARPIAEWPQAINSTLGNLQQIESELSGCVQCAALLQSYLSYRYNTGCGDHGHDRSARHANKELVKIRRAMGFSYPNQHCISM